MLVAELSREGIRFRRPEVDSLPGEVIYDSRPMLVAVAGTEQKIDLLGEIVRPGQTGALVGGFETYNRIEVNEINGNTGGEIVLQKMTDFADEMWQRVDTGSNEEHRAAIIGKRVFIGSDTKMAISRAGEGFVPVHKLRTELIGSGIDSSELLERLPAWWVGMFEKMVGKDDAVIRWSTGNAAFKYLQNQDGSYNGDRVMVWGDSKASLILPNSILLDQGFWKEYLQYGMSIRKGQLSAHLGASMGVLVEDFVAMLTDSNIGEDYARYSWDQLNIRLPKIPRGIDQRNYLEQHAKGAASDVVVAVLGKVLKLKKKGIYSVGTRDNI